MYRLYSFILLSFICFTLSACSRTEQAVSSEDSDSAVVPRENTGAVDVYLNISGNKVYLLSDETEAGHTNTTASGLVVPVVSDDKYQQARVDAGITDKAINACMQAQDGLWHYDHLADSEKRLYAEVLLILKLHRTEVKVEAEDYASLYSAFLCVMEDHPELYWVDGYTYLNYYNEGDDTEYFAFSGYYSFTPEECEAVDKEIEAWSDEFFADITASDTDYDVEKKAYEYIARTTTYDSSAEHSQSMISVVRGSSVCQGYSKAFQYLMQRSGIPCTMIAGYVKNRMGHAWNMVSLNGLWYFVDATWGDDNETGLISYAYLNMTSKDLEASHEINDILVVPDCMATEYSYYTLHDTVFDGYDATRLKNLLNHPTGYVLVKCSSQKAYEDFEYNAIFLQRAFKMMPLGVTDLMYKEQEESRVVEFWW